VDAPWKKSTASAWCSPPTDLNTRAPDLFSRGPSPLARTAFYCTLAALCIVVDFRFHQLDAFRKAVSVVIYPLQQVASFPGWLTQRIAQNFETEKTLREENAALRMQLLKQADIVQQQPFLQSELDNLKALDGLATPTEARRSVAEIIALAHNPFIQKIFIGRGSDGEIQPGSPVISQDGVVGQVTAVYPFYSEVSLITDKNQALPVMVQRNGLRAIAYGSGQSGMLLLPYVPAVADVQKGDLLVTSGLDGVYPPGLSVGTVTEVRRDTAAAFTRVSANPTAAVNSRRYVLVLGGSRTGSTQVRIPETPTIEDQAAARPGKKTKVR
jgi:rod shape-determining protein MreC